jgi:hypothetical protein
MPKIFTMKNTSATLLVLAGILMILAFTVFGDAEAFASQTQALAEAKVSTPTKDVEVVVLPVSPAWTPERVENLVTRWGMVVMSLISIVGGIIVALWAKINEVKRAAAVEKVNADQRASRQDDRVETARVEANTAKEEVKNLEVKVATLSTPPASPDKPTQT